ncbi:MAG: amino acid permease [Chthoniobacteraceae bacterium]|nr:amino acid permease [Chthoniobacteraceae bacterium]
MHSNEDSAAAQPSISGVTATAIVVANMVGTGVFTSLGFQVGGLPSGFALLLLWTLGGVCAFCGALAYAELAAALPRSGGEYHFLSAIFHPSVGFVAGWASATAGFAAPVALAAMAFGSYFQGVVAGVPALALSLALVGAVSAVHLCGARAGSVFQNFFTWGKVLLILVFIGAGWVLCPAQPLAFSPQPGDWGRIASAPFAISLIYVMYAYSGWNASAYITREVGAPGRNVPRSLLAGTLIVMALYLGLNFIFLRTTPLSALEGQVQIGSISGARIFGAGGGRWMSGLICLALVSSVSSMTWIGPRVTMAMGEDLALLRFLGRKTRRGVPAMAILFQLAIVVLLLCTASFQMALVYVQFTLLLCSFLTVLGMMILRRTRPDLPRPYRAWGYPFTPLLFLGVTLWMMGYVARTQPWESLAGLATLALGLVLYFVSPRGGVTKTSPR